MGSKKPKQVEWDKQEEGVVFLVADSGYKTSCKVRTATFCKTLRAVRDLIRTNEMGCVNVWRLFENAPGSEKIKGWEMDAVLEGTDDGEYVSEEEEDEDEDEQDGV